MKSRRDETCIGISEGFVQGAMPGDRRVCFWYQDDRQFFVGAVSRHEIKFCNSIIGRYDTEARTITAPLTVDENVVPDTKGYFLPTDKIYRKVVSALRQRFG